MWCNCVTERPLRADPLAHLRLAAEMEALAVGINIALVNIVPTMSGRSCGSRSGRRGGRVTRLKCPVRQCPPQSPTPKALYDHPHHPGSGRELRTVEAKVYDAENILHPATCAHCLYAGPDDREYRR